MWQGVKRKKTSPPKPNGCFNEVPCASGMQGEKEFSEGQGLLHLHKVWVETTWFNHSLRALCVLTSKTIVDPEILLGSCSQDLTVLVTNCKSCFEKNNSNKNKSVVPPTAKWFIHGVGNWRVQRQGHRDLGWKDLFLTAWILMDDILWG